MNRSLVTYPPLLPPAPPKIGFCAVLHEIRSDYAQILTTIFLLINGPGRWSLDAILFSESRHADAIRPLIMRTADVFASPVD